MARAALVLLCVNAALTDLIAAVVPLTFYESFPFFAHWVNRLPPYNHHLVIDVGALYLGLAVVFGCAAKTLDQAFVRAASCAWLLVASLHLVLHSSHLQDFGAADAVAQTVVLGSLLVPAVVAVLGVGPRRRHAGVQR